METRGFKRIVLNFVEKFTFQLSTKVYPNSYGLKAIILKNRFTTNNKLRIIGNGSSNGIDTSYFNPKLFSKEENQILKTNLKIRNSEFLYIFVGRIVGDKGINELIKAFNELSIENKKVKLLLVGPFENDLEPLKKNKRAY